MLRLPTIPVLTAIALCAGYSNQFALSADGCYDAGYSCQGTCCRTKTVKPNVTVCIAAKQPRSYKGCGRLCEPLPNAAVVPSVPVVGLAQPVALLSQPAALGLTTAQMLPAAQLRAAFQVAPAQTSAQASVEQALVNAVARRIASLGEEQTDQTEGEIGLSQAEPPSLEGRVDGLEKGLARLEQTLDEMNRDWQSLFDQTVDQLDQRLRELRREASKPDPRD